MTYNAIIINDITPRFDVDYGHGTSLRSAGAYRIATSLSQICNVQILDYFFHISFDTQKKILEKFISKDTHLLGFSLTNLRGHTKTNKQHSLFDKFDPLGTESNSVFYFHEQARLIIEYINKKYNNIKIVIGGGQILNIKPNGLKYLDKYIDYVLTGESDISIQHLYEHITKNSKLKFDNFWSSTTIGREGENPYKFHFNKTRIIHSDKNFNVNKEYVKNNILIDHKKIGSNLFENEWLFVEVGRGCSFNCYFCSYRHTNKRRSTDSIKEEIIKNYTNFGITKFRFMDDTFNDKKSKVEEICDMLLSLPFKVEWHCYARVDTFNTHENLALLMYEAGCKYLKFGLESTNNEALKFANKPFSHEKVVEILNTIDQLTKKQLYMHSNFIIGLPGETIESQRRTFDWLKKSPLTTFSFTTWFRDKFYEEDLDIREMSEYGKLSYENIHGISGFGNNWKHNTMTSSDAYMLYHEAYNVFKHHNHSPYWVGSDLYPILRSYGIKHEEVHSKMKNVMKSYTDKRYKNTWLEKKFINHTEKYFNKFNVNPEIIINRPTLN